MKVKKYKKYKIVFFNPEKISKRVQYFTFVWDYINHEWDVTIKDIFGENTRSYTGIPEDMVRHFAEFKHKGEFVTIK